MHGLRRALILSTGERYITLTANFAVLVIAARLMSPADFGVLALGSSIALIAAAVREFATPIFLIQQEATLERSDIATSFTVLFLLGCLLAVVLVAIAEPLARLYAHDELALFIKLTAITVVAEAFVLPVNAVLRRNMRFDAVVAISASGSTTMCVVTLTLTAFGLKAVAFAWGWLAGALCMAVLSAWAHGDLSIFRLSLTSWRRALSFGGYAGAGALLYRLYEAVPALFFGRILPLEALGLYTRAISLCQLPEKILLGGISSVALPALSSELRNGGSMKTAYLSGVEHITALYWPALAALVLLAEPIVLLLLGPQWEAVVPLVQIMAIAGFFSFTAELNYPMLLAIGALRDLLLRSLISWPLSALILIAAAPFGVTVLAAAMLIVVPLQAYVSIYFVRRHIPIAWREIAWAVRKSAVVAVTTTAAIGLVRAAAGFPDHLTLALTACALLGGAAGWGIGVWASGHPLLHQLVTLIGARGTLTRKREVTT